MKQRKGTKMSIRMTDEEYAEMRVICEETGVSSPYKIAQILVKWFLGWWQERKTMQKETLGDCIQAEIQEEFDRLADTLEPVKSFTTDRMHR